LDLDEDKVDTRSGYVPRRDYGWGMIPNGPKVKDETQMKEALEIINDNIIASPDETDTSIAPDWDFDNCDNSVDCNQIVAKMQATQDLANMSPTLQSVYEIEQETGKDECDEDLFSEDLFSVDELIDLVSENGGDENIEESMEEDDDTNTPIFNISGITILLSDDSNCPMFNKFSHISQ
jgi:hypothetical protein